MKWTVLIAAISSGALLYLAACGGGGRSSSPVMQSPDPPVQEPDPPDPGDDELQEQGEPTPMAASITMTNLPDGYWRKGLAKLPNSGSGQDRR